MSYLVTKIMSCLLILPVQCEAYPGHDETRVVCPGHQDIELPGKYPVVYDAEATEPRKECRYEAETNF